MIFPPVTFSYPKESCGVSYDFRTESIKNRNRIYFLLYLPWNVHSVPLKILYFWIFEFLFSLLFKYMYSVSCDLILSLFQRRRFEGKIFLQTSCLVVCVTECQSQLNCLSFFFFFFFNSFSIYWQWPLVKGNNLRLNFYKYNFPLKIF